MSKKKVDILVFHRAAKGGENRFAHPKMKRSTASRGAFAILVALPLLPLCVIVLHGPPAIATRNLAPLQGAVDSAARNPGVSLRSTPGYGLGSLRDGPGNENVARNAARCLISAS